MSTLKKFVLATVVALSLAGVAIGGVTTLQPSTDVVADSGHQRGDFDAG